MQAELALGHFRVGLHLILVVETKEGDGSECYFAAAKVIQKFLGKVSALGQPARAATVAGLGLDERLAVNVNQMSAAGAHVVAVIDSQPIPVPRLKRRHLERAA